MLDMIQDILGREEIFVQLAEEAAELAQAALKYRRAYNGANPTPVSAGEAFEKLLEEVADVELCISVSNLDTAHCRKKIEKIKAAKLDRWAQRLGLDVQDS